MRYKPGQVQHDFTSPIHAKRESPAVDNWELEKYRRKSSLKTARVALLDRHLLTAANQRTCSLWIL